MYRFDTKKDNYEITIDGQTGEFFLIYGIITKIFKIQSKYITEEQAKELANKYYKLFGYKDGGIRNYTCSLCKQ